jgi:3-hydroxybutyryl-CoA dehydratase
MLSFRKGYTWDEISVGDAAQFTKTVTESDVQAFCGITGDFNPAHTDEVYMRVSKLGQKMRGRIAHGALVSSLISTVLGMCLPGKGCLYLSQSSSFKAPVHFGDTITARVEALEKLPKNRIRFRTVCFNQRGETVIDGEAQVIAASSREFTE